MSVYMGPRLLLTTATLAYMPAYAPSSTLVCPFFVLLRNTPPLWGSHAQPFSLSLFFMGGRSEKGCSERRNFFFWHVKKVHRNISRNCTPRITQKCPAMLKYFSSSWLSIWGVNQFQRQKSKRVSLKLSFFCNWKETWKSFIWLTNRTKSLQLFTLISSVSQFVFQQT